MIHNFESWFRSRTGVNEQQMVIKVGSAGGGSKKSSGGSSSGGAAAAKTPKTPKSSIDIAQVAAFFEALPGRGDTKKDPWGPNSASCVFPHLDKRYEIFVWTNGFAVRETEQFKFILGSDSNHLKLTLTDYAGWTGSYVNTSNVKVDFAGWEDFRNKLFGQQADAAVSGFGPDDSTKADQLVTEMLGLLDDLVKNRLKSMFGAWDDDDEDGAVKYIANQWFRSGRPNEIMMELGKEYEKLPPQTPKGTKDRVKRNIEKLNWEIGGCASGSGFGNKMLGSTGNDTFIFNWESANGPESLSIDTDF